MESAKMKSFMDALTPGYDRVKAKELLEDPAINLHDKRLGNIYEPFLDDEDAVKHLMRRHVKMIYKHEGSYTSVLHRLVEMGIANKMGDKPNDNVLKVMRACLEHDATLEHSPITPHLLRLHANVGGIGGRAIDIARGQGFEEGVSVMIPFCAAAGVEIPG